MTLTEEKKSVALAEEEEEELLRDALELKEEGALPGRAEDGLLNFTAGGAVGEWLRGVSVS